DAEEAAQDAVFVEALDRVDRRLDVALERTRAALTRPPRVEAQVEELDELSCDRRVGCQRVLHVVLAEGAARLPQVFRDRAEDGDLAGGELRREDELVETVVLCLVAPGAGERVLERLAHAFGLELGAERVAKTEVVDPH